MSDLFKHKQRKNFFLLCCCNKKHSRSGNSFLEAETPLFEKPAHDYSDISKYQDKELKRNCELPPIPDTECAYVALSVHNNSVSTCGLRIPCSPPSSEQENLYAILDNIVCGTETISTNVSNNVMESTQKSNFSLPESDQFNNVYANGTHNEPVNAEIDTDVLVYATVDKQPLANAATTSMLCPVIPPRSYRLSEVECVLALNKKLSSDHLSDIEVCRKSSITSHLEDSLLTNGLLKAQKMCTLASNQSNINCVNGKCKENCYDSGALLTQDNQNTQGDYNPDGNCSPVSMVLKEMCDFRHVDSEPDISLSLTPSECLKHGNQNIPSALTKTMTKNNFAFAKPIPSINRGHIFE